jgi:hypothetical protein
LFRSFNCKTLNQILALIAFLFTLTSVYSQCVTCGNGSMDIGETNLNCPQDVPHNASCTSPCDQPTAFETTAGIRQSIDFVGTTTFSSAGLPAGWAFGSAPSATTAGTLAGAGTDAYGGKAGLVQPNCSGSCTGTNGFCIGNLANLSAVGSGGTGGKLGANFDGRANVNQNLSYAILRGQGNPTLVSETYNFSSVEGFKLQFWLFPSESSCGQGNAWGSCVGNVAYLDFSANGGTTWTQILTINLSSANADMCTNNNSNTLWLSGSSWSRVCLTVFRSTTSPGNFYTAASASSAPSGIMVNSAYFVSSFKYRIRYAQTASCTSGITATNPGRYLAIDYPVTTSGDEMIPCGISFANMCGYGADNNDDGVGNTTTATASAFGTVLRGFNQAERGAEIFNSQNASFLSQNLSGSNFTTNFDLCNAEGGDKQCIDWRTNNNFHQVVYECITDWEAPSGTGIILQYYKGVAAQSFGLSKVTAAGRTAAIGWRYSGSRFVSCGSTSDLNPGCNGYSFRSGSLPTQFARGFYGLAINSSGQSWTYYGATSCSHYFNGPFIAPIAVPDTVSGSGNYTVCVGGNLRFLGTVDHCQTATGLSGSASLSITGPGSFSETITAGDTGIVNITIPGDYTITAEAPATPTPCIDCSRSVCVSISQLDIDNCLTALPVELIHFAATSEADGVRLDWATFTEQNNAGFEIERSRDNLNYKRLIGLAGTGYSNTMINYSWLDEAPVLGKSYYRLVQIDFDGNRNYSAELSVEWIQKEIELIPNPASNEVKLVLPIRGEVVIRNAIGAVVLNAKSLEQGEHTIQLTELADGTYFLEYTTESGSFIKQLFVVR